MIHTLEESQTCREIIVKEWYVLRSESTAFENGKGRSLKIEHDNSFKTEHALQSSKYIGIQL